MENTLTYRVKIVMENEGLSPSSFADTIGVLRPSMSHIISGRNKPSIDIIQRIITTLPHYSPIWLINGTGNMLQLDMFESEDDLREKIEEKKIAKALNKKKTIKSNNNNVNFVKQALESNILDDDKIKINIPEYKTENTTPTSIETPDNDQKEINIVNKEDKILSQEHFNLTEEDIPDIQTTINIQKTTTENTSMINEPIQNKVKEEPQAIYGKPKQENKIDPLMTALGMSSKKIERIVVFYDDKTFSVYNPE